MKNYLTRIMFLGGNLLFLYFNLTVWRSSWLGLIFFVTFILILGTLWQDIFSRVFRMKHSNWMTVLFAWFASFILLGLVSGVFVVWYTLTPFIIWWCYFITGMITVLIWILSKRNYKLKINTELITKNYKSRDFVVFKAYHAALLVYIVLWGVALYFLVISKNTEALFSPWQTISPYFLPIFLFLTVILGLLLFSKHKTKILIIFVILHSLLIHLYLPIAHTNPWGGDVWRHVAVEQKIIDGEFQLPIIVGPEARWREVFGADIPEVFVIPHKYVYGHLWGTSIVLAETLQINLIAINIWLIPLLWAIFLPIIFFRIGRILFGSWKKGLWLAWLAFIPFPFQALGGLSLPVSLGYLTFFFVLMLWLHYLQDGRIWQRRIVLLFSVLMLFGYTLHFILIWLVIGLTFLVRRISNIRKQVIKNISISLLFVFSISIFPIIELLGGTSKFSLSWNFVEQAKQFVGQFSGWYYASAIRPHDILSGNILFNHTPDYAFVSSIFTDWRWHVIPVMILIAIVMKFGFYKMFKEEDLKARIFQLLGSIVIGGYIIGWFYLDGDRSFVRRLDPMFAFLVLTFFVYGISNIKYNIKNNEKTVVKIVVFTSVLLLSWFGTTTYASGPDMRVASVGEYEVAKYIWDTADRDQNNFCILADTWILLPLEGTSSGNIVGGGFPIDYQFGQNERIQLIKKIAQEPESSDLEKAQKLTKTDGCVLVLPKSDLDEERKVKINEIFGEELYRLDEFYIWGVGLKE